VRSQKKKEEKKERWKTLDHCRNQLTHAISNIIVSNIIQRGGIMPCSQDVK